MGFSLRIPYPSALLSPWRWRGVARLHGLARWLKAFGHEVTVVTGMPDLSIGHCCTALSGQAHLSQRRSPRRHPACLTRQYALRKPR